MEIDSLLSRNGGPLPEWVKEFRPHQREAVTQTIAEYEGGAGVVVLDAPTGSGKTLIAETVRLLLQVRGLYVCTTKSLQEQMGNDYSYARILKGRSNYPTLKEELFGGRMGISAADCTKHDDGTGVRVCEWCDEVRNCPYERAKNAALSADLAVINTSYFLTEANRVGRFSKRDFTVVDEADTIESEIMRYVGVEITPQRVRELGLGEPEKVTKEDSWKEWAERAGRILNGAVSKYKLDRSSIQSIRGWTRLSNLERSIGELAKGLEEGGWIYTGKDGRVSFKPIQVRDLAPKLLWQHSKKWLLMSATVISPQILISDLGFGGNWSYVSVPSTFGKERRQVKFTPVANVIAKEKAVAYGEVARGIDKVIARHRGERVLVHTVSYDLAGFLGAHLQGREGSGEQVFSYGGASERDEALRGFTNGASGLDGSGRPTDETTTRILLAPSMDRGIDLPNDLCRVIIIAKVPYPYLGDRQVSARLHSKNGQMWYNVQTIRSIVQMTGRGMRHEDDECTTYILDRQFLNIYNNARRLFPKWWMESVVWDDKL